MIITIDHVFKVCDENEIELTETEMEQVVTMYYDGNHNTRTDYYDEIILELIDELKA